MNSIQKGFEERGKMMNKKLVLGLALAAMLSGISGVHADYSDADIDGKITELDGKITAEKNARGELENKLSTKLEGMRNALNFEIKNRETKDTELDGKISDEAKARETKDTELGGMISDEAKARETKDKELDGKISDEETARKAEDTKIREEFAKAGKKLDGKISDEETARKAEDTKIREEFAKADDKVRAELAAAGKVLGQRIDQLATDTDKGLAKVSALAGLHPLDYDSANKLNVAAAGGSYNGEHAFALGAFYRPNRNIMISLGSTIAGGDKACNVGISVKVGKGGDRMGESNATVSELYALIGRMQEEMNAQKAEMMEQREQIAAQQRKIAELEAR